MSVKKLAGVEKRLIAASSRDIAMIKSPFGCLESSFLFSFLARIKLSAPRGDFSC